MDPASSERSFPVVCHLYDTLLVGEEPNRERGPTAGHAERLRDSSDEYDNNHVTVWV